MNIDVATTFKVILVLLGIVAITSLVMAVKSIKAGHKLLFYQKRQLLVNHGWRLIMLAAALVLSGFLLTRFGEPIVYKYLPPSPTITQTPTITITPTITNTPSMTYTPTITLTLAQTYTPSFPESIQATIQTPIGPESNAIFSQISFSDQIKDGLIEEAATEFSLPLTTLFGGFSYDRMAEGVQWTAIWLYGEDVICAETKPWNYAPGGYGYTDCTPSGTSWRPGIYEVKMFAGSTWKVTGTFRILGDEIDVGSVPTAIGSPLRDVLTVTSTPEPPTN
ncbi:MAG: hypothetical protein KBD67_02420 [Anaerolineaceae bacterium]|nr:hypothetical protein [Anaerolineaceae bacterium]